MGPSQHAIIVRGKERGEEVSCNKKKKNYVDIKKPKYTFNVFATCEDGFIDFGLRSLQPGHFFSAMLFFLLHRGQPQHAAFDSCSLANTDFSGFELVLVLADFGVFFWGVGVLTVAFAPVGMPHPPQNMPEHGEPQFPQKEGIPSQSRIEI